MPDENKTVDIDTSGPGAEIELETPNQEKDHDVVETSSESNDSPEKPSEQSTVQTSEPKTTEQETVTQDTEEKKQELDDYSEGVKRRIGKLTKKMREHERREEAAIEYAKRVQQEHEALKARLSKLDTGYVSEMENRIKSSMEAAVAKLSRAREEGDIKAEVAAQTEISKLGYEEARLADMKIRQETDVKEEKPALTQRVQQEQQPINPDPKAQAWAESNEWFGKDDAMTYTAISMHKKLTDEEGFDPQSDEYYEEINKRIRLEFPHKFATVESQSTVKPTQVVASANRSSRPGRKTVRLTSSQVAIAKKLGVPLEEYAKQLNITKE